jgi:uncharacterized protein RhaS with RHS repeats
MRAHDPLNSRWLSPDPASKKAAKLIDPQTWNMYAYVRNSPTTLTDPSGLDISCISDRCADYLKALQENLSFKIVVDKGKISTQGYIDKKGLSKSEKALLKAISDPKHHVTINAVGGGRDASVFFGRSDAPHSGVHTIAFDQAALLDASKNSGGMTSADLVAHETLEGYSESQGNSLSDAHKYANRFFGGLDPTAAGSALVQGGMVTGIIGNFVVHGTQIIERITMHMVSPVPAVDFLGGVGAPYPVYPIEVEVGP